MHARILVEHQKTTEHRRIPAMMELEYAGPRCERTPVLLRSHSRHRLLYRRHRRRRLRHYRHRLRHYRRRLPRSAETRRRLVLSTGEPPLLHSRALERWPQITVRECRKRPARHSTRAARYKRCNEPALLSTRCCC